MIRTISFAALGALLVYLLGAFAAASFNVATWPGEGRTFCALCMFIAAGLGVIWSQP